MPTKGEKTRADLVDCASRLFYEHGYDGTSFADIVAASGLQRGNIYHYFKTKDEILLAVVERHLTEFRALLLEWEAEHTDPKARLAALVDMIVGRGPDLVEFGCPLGTLNSELAKDRRDLQQAARALFDQLRDWLAARFVELGRGAEAENLALHLLARAQGIALIAHVYRTPAFLAREAAGLKAWIVAL